MQPCKSTVLNWPFLRFSGGHLWMQRGIPAMARSGVNTDKNNSLNKKDTCTYTVVTKPFYLEVPWTHTFTRTITLFQHTINHCVETNYFTIIFQTCQTQATVFQKTWHLLELWQVFTCELLALVLTAFKSLPSKESCNGALSLLSNRCCTTWKMIETLQLLDKHSEWLVSLTDNFFNRCTWTRLNYVLSSCMIIRKNSTTDQ